MLRHTLHFTGRVQGVGFRCTAQKVAARFAVAGYVENLDDGRVLLVIEGDDAEIDRFITALLDTMRDNIRSRTHTTSPSTGEFGEPRPGALSIRR